MKELIPFVSCVCKESEFQEALDKGYAEIYISTSTGILKHQKLTGGRHIRLKVERVPKKVADILEEEAPSVTEEMNFLPAGKIPMKLYQQVVKFFLEVMKVKNADHEAHCFILWNEKDGYHISVPKQTVSKASVSFVYDEDAIPSGSVVVVDWHSHNTMGAFYSGTDENNDKNGIYYSGVIGRLDKPSHEYVLRFNLHDAKRKVTLEEVFEAAEEKIEIPSEWLDKVEVKTYPKHVGPMARTGNATSGLGSSIGRTIPAMYESLWDMQMRHLGMNPDEVVKGKGKEKEAEDEEGIYVNQGLSLGEFDTDSIDPVGSDSEEFCYNAAQFGVAVAEAKEQIESYLVDLEGNDEILRDIMKQSYELLSRKGQESLQTFGF